MGSCMTTVNKVINDNHNHEPAQRGDATLYIWGVLADAGEAVHARAILGEDTPWTRLFELAELPTYRLITVEFLSTFRYRAHQAAVREEDDEELPPDIEFSLGGQHFQMSIEWFFVHLASIMSRKPFVTTSHRG
ncbi:hypothetical protein R6Q57_013962 [Mikania cordata]